jgi:monooxygenase
VTAPTASTDTPEHLDVLIVGAGLSGIGAAYRVQTECPWATYAVLEARDAIGGTWDLFRYPGIRSDSDMFTLGYPFRPWGGERSIADGDSILRYIRDTAAEFGIDERIRFQHRVVTAEWSSEDAVWHVTAERTDTGARVRLTAGWVLSCTGYYRYDHGYTPELPGMDDYQGTLVHPQHWPEDLDHAGKQVVVIGSGATAITLIPSMAQDAGHVTMLQRSPTYVVALPGKDPIANLLRRVLPASVSGPTVRWFKALTTQASYRLSKSRPDLMKRLLRKGVQRQLPKGFDVDTHFSPRYDPWDQRLCVAPDGDLFQAIRDGKASVVTDHIETFTPTGIRLESGRELQADIVVTATGLDLLFLGGIELAVDGEKVDVSERMAYKGVMLDGVPNWAMAFGYANASWTLKADLTCQYVTRLLNHLRRSGMRQATPMAEGTDISGDPLFGLSSGYVLRAADRFPKQGAKDPWRVHHSYLRDHRALRRSSIHDDVMAFSNPAPAPAPAEPVPAAAAAG